jgi:hypothetical protein
MRRLLFNATALASTVLAVLLWAACARTWFAQDTVERYGWMQEDRRFVSRGLGWSDGRIQAWSNTLDAAPGKAVPDKPLNTRFRSTPVVRNFWGWAWFMWESHPPRPVLSVAGQNVPGQYAAWSGGVRIWPVATAASVVPAVWVMRRSRARRIRRGGLCPKCLYDLRATPTRCPECGYEPHAAQRAAAAGV